MSKIDLTHPDILKFHSEINVDEAEKLMGYLSNTNPKLSFSFYKEIRGNINKGMKNVSSTIMARINTQNFYGSQWQDQRDDLNLIFLNKDEMPDLNTFASSNEPFHYMRLKKSQLCTDWRDLGDREKNLIRLIIRHSEKYFLP